MANKILRGLAVALEYAKCAHEWSDWHDAPRGRMRRTCSKCGATESRVAI